MKQPETINLSIEMPLTGFDGLALRRLGGLVARHVGLSFEKTEEDAGYEMCQGHISPRPALAGLRFELGERAPDEAQECARFIAGLCQTARLGRTALYCRTAVADPEAIAAQRAALERFAEARGFGSIACYEDDGDPDLVRTHTGFGQLEQDVRAGEIRRVLAENLRCLGRSTAEAVRWTIWLRQHGAEIYTLDTPADLNAALETLENA